MNAAKVPISRRVWILTLGPPMVIALIAFGTAAYLTSKMSDSGAATKEVIDFGSRAFFGAGGLVSAAVALQALHLNANRSRIEAAFEFLQRYDQSDFITIRHFLDETVHRAPPACDFDLEKVSPAQGKGFYEAMHLRAGIGDKVRGLLGLFEDMSLGIATGHADERTLYRSLRPSVVYFMERLLPYVRYERDRTGDASYYEDALRLVRAWCRQRSVISGGKIRPIWNES